MTTATFDDLSALAGSQEVQQAQQAQQAVASPPQKPAFVPPPVKIGDIVFWYSSARKTNRPCPFLVNDVEGNVISGHIFAKGKHPMPVMGIRHVDDPFLSDHQFVCTKDGAWGAKG